MLDCPGVGSADWCVTMPETHRASGAQKGDLTSRRMHPFPMQGPQHGQGGPHDDMGCGH